MSTSHAPSSTKLIEREDFLSSVEPRRVMLLRMRTETPGIHMLGLFSDLNEQYAILQEIGPQGVYPDMAAAAANAPAGLRLAYVIPCAECAPFALPPNTAKGKLPASLSELKAPPKNFSELAPTVTVDKKTGFAVTSAPTRPAQSAHKNGGTTTSTTTEAKPAPAVEKAEVMATAEPATATPKQEKPTDAPKQATGALAALGLTLEKMQQATKSVESLQQRELELRRERAEFQESCAHRLLELESREFDLTRRENELALRIATLNELLIQIDTLRRVNLDPGSDT